MSLDSDLGTDLAGRTVRGSAYGVAAAAVTLPLGFARAVILARLLLPEHFGVAALALFFVQLAGHLRGFGLDAALIHHGEADERVLETYFTLRMALSLGTLGLLVAATPILSGLYADMPLFGPVLLAYAGIGGVKAFNTVGVTLLNKRLAFRHLALTDILSAVVMTVVGPYLAWRGWGVWSLVGELATGVLARTLTVWVLVRPWRPRIGWDPAVARWFWSFGARVWTSGNLGFLLDRFDDFWTGTFLGKTPLGYYSKAYELAGYPRRVVANPVVSVFFPAFARLRDEPVRLARAFFRMSSVVLRFGFWVSLVFVLGAPEFIRLFLGERWLPMTLTFQLMIVYTLLDPLVSGASSLLTAIGRPGLVVRARLVQAAVFLPAVVALGSLAGIEGVAVAADLMLVVGALLLFRDSRRFIAYSLGALALWPGVALVLAAVVAWAVSGAWTGLSPAVVLAGKALLVTVVYWGVLFLAERERLRAGFDMIRGLVRPRSTSSRRG